jgi:hypothetical protein
MEEIDIWRAATTWIRSMGFTTASFAAGHTAKDLRTKGDIAGAEVWEKIRDKIEELEQIGYRPDATKH